MPIMLVRDLELSRSILFKDFVHFTDRGVYCNERNNLLSEPIRIVWTTSTLSFCLYKLAKNPDIPERVHDEIDQVLHSHKLCAKSNYVQNNVFDMNYSEACINGLWILSFYFHSVFMSEKNGKFSIGIGFFSETVLNSV